MEGETTSLVPQGKTDTPVGDEGFGVGGDGAGLFKNAAQEVEVLQAMQKLGSLAVAISHPSGGRC